MEANGRTPKPQMRSAYFFRIAVLLCAAFLAAALARAEDIKSIHPTGYVTDLAGVIDAEKKASLEALCGELEQKTGAQMAVVTVRSLEGESVETYAVDLFKHLGIGSKKDNRGVLLLIAPTERKYRIEVGYGLEPVINDARAGDAGRAMVPYLRQGDYNSAVEIAAWQLAKFIADDRGVVLAGGPAAHPYPANDGESRFPVPWIGLVVFVVLILRVLSWGIAAGGTRRRGPWWIGPVVGGLGGSGGGGGWGGGGGFGGVGGGRSGGGGASGGW